MKKHDRFYGCYSDVVIGSTSMYDINEANVHNGILLNSNMTVREALDYSYENFVKKAGRGCCLNYSLGVISAWEKIDGTIRNIILIPEGDSGDKAAILIREKNKLFVSDPVVDILQTREPQFFCITLEEYLKKEGVKESEATFWNIQNENDDFLTTYRNRYPLTKWKEENGL